VIDKILFREVSSSGGPAKADRAVMFVHGFTGDAVDTWKAEGAKSFCELIASDPEFTDHDVLVFQYKSKTLTPPSIPNIAAQLLFAIDTCGYERIIFIAHSMGGLVVMNSILQTLQQGQTGKVAGLLLYGVPMSGVEWAKYAQLVLSAAGLVYPHLNVLQRIFSSNKQITALTRDSEFIEELTGKWARRVLNGGDPNIDAGQRAAFPVRVVSGNDDWVVKESSARGLYAEIDWINVPEDHRTLVKPPDRSAFSYLIASKFLRENRTWMSPALLLKLRNQIDRIWALRQQETISSWNFDLEFESNSTQTPGASSAAKRIGAGLTEFSPFRVRRCEYKRRIPTTVLRFGFAAGHLTSDSVWNNTFVFLHRINFSALSPELTDRLEKKIREVLSSTPQDAWDALFQEALIRVSGDHGGSWYDLEPGAIAIKSSSLVREYALPSQAKHLCGEEALIDVSFRSLRPTASCDYTTTFPWGCDGFTTSVTVLGQPRYLIYSSGMRGTAAIQSNRQHQTQLQCSSVDLILPGSTLQFEWSFEREAV
jgi:pimeloyl-ACP methyl ester carboxylesterase